MDPVSREASATAALVESALVESSEALIGPEGLQEQLSTIRCSSAEAVAARNEAAIREIAQLETNRRAGAAREAAVGSELQSAYPPEQGYNIESETYLRTQDGRIACDPGIQEASGLEGTRRLDYVVIRDGQVIESVEVTSELAPKKLQVAKEERIREAGGNYVRERSTGELIPFAPGVRTNIVRRA